jgi:2'-5' RNA ligase
MHMYFVALVLPKELNEKILAFKHYMHEKYGCAVGLKSPAHITIVPPFWMDEEKQNQLENDIHALSSQQQSFSIEACDFSAFKPRTIFVAVAPNQNLKELKTKSDIFFHNHPSYKIQIEGRPFHPHITIATRDLHKKDFHEAWAYFEPKKFSGTWTADGLSLLKHNKKNWDVVHTSQFQKL